MDRSILVECKKCLHTMTLAEKGWSAVICQGCKAEVPYPSKEELEMWRQMALAFPFGMPLMEMEVNDER